MASGCQAEVNLWSVFFRKTKEGTDFLVSLNCTGLQRLKEFLHIIEK